MRIILLLDMDAFFAQVEERENPRFRGKPVVVGADPKGGKGRGVVSTANYEARKYGIKSALPISLAWKKNPEAVFLPVNMPLYARVSGNIMEILKKELAEIGEPKMERVSLDEAYGDLSILKSFKNAEVFAENLKKKIFQKENLKCTIGIGPNKMLAKIACVKAKPDGLKTVLSEEAGNFLDPLDISEIPGIGPKTKWKLNNKGIFTILHLRKMAENDLVDEFGKNGKTIWLNARGIDNREVEEGETKSIGRAVTFEKDTRDFEEIFSAFYRAVKEVFEDLKTHNFKFRTITVVCRFQGFETHTKSLTLEKSADDFDTLKKNGKKLLLKFLVENLKPIRLIGIRVSGLET